MRYIFIFTLILGVSFNVIANENARSLFSKGNGVTFNTQMKVEVSVNKKVLPNLAEENKNSGKVTVNTKSNFKDSDVRKQEKPKDVKATDYAGFSYQLLKETKKGKFKRVSPGYDFKTGDRIVVEVMSNSDGYLITGNIDSLEKPRLLSLNQIKSGKTIRIPQKGALKFVEPAGTEKLVFVLSNQPIDKSTSEKYVKKCDNKTRSIVFVEDDAGQNYQLLSNDGSCKTKNKSVKTRSIIVDVEDDIGYGVVESDTLTSGSLLSLIINLKHSWGRHEIFPNFCIVNNSRL